MSVASVSGSGRPEHSSSAVKRAIEIAFSTVAAIAGHVRSPVVAAPLRPTT